MNVDNVVILESIEIEKELKYIKIAKKVKKR
jgi:hypothetical protein